ncbi:MAG: lysozyme inhibitor LprI family protein [Janthinobacterium lividum]
MTDAVEEACLAHSGGVTTALHACLAASAKRADVRLNAAYRRASAGLLPPVRARLVAAQRAWLQFRDLDCAVIVAREAGGSDAPLAADQCVTRLTTARAGDLEDLASGN